MSGLTAQRCHGTFLRPLILRWITCFTGRWTGRRESTGWCCFTSQSIELNLISCMMKKEAFIHQYELKLIDT